MVTDRNPLCCSISSHWFISTVIKEAAQSSELLVHFTATSMSVRGTTQRHLLPTMSCTELLYIRLIYIPGLQMSNAVRGHTFRVRLVESLPGDPGFMRQGLQVVPRLHVDNAVQIILRRRAEDACTQRRVRDMCQYGY